MYNFNSTNYIINVVNKELYMCSYVHYTVPCTCIRVYLYERVLQISRASHVHILAIGSAASYRTLYVFHVIGERFDDGQKCHMLADEQMPCGMERWAYCDNLCTN